MVQIERLWGWKLTSGSCRVLTIGWHVRGLYRCLWYALGLCLCPCVITPKGFTPLLTEGGVWVFGFYWNRQTNKRTNKGPTLVLMWWFVKLTWQVDLSPCLLAPLHITWQVITCQVHLSSQFDKLSHQHKCRTLVQLSDRSGGYRDSAIDWCCFYYFLRNSLVALLEALFARLLGESCWPKKWGANREKSCTEIEK